MRGSLLLAVTMTFALVGCGKKGAKAPDSPPAGGGGGGGSGGGGAIVAGGGVGVVVNPGAMLGGGGGGGAAMAVRKAARRASAMNDLRQLGETIEAMRDPTGRMPSRDAVLAEMKRSMPKVYEGITEGAYVLADPMLPGGLWAYEVDADKTPGLAVIQGRVQRSTPDELQPHFAAMPKPAEKKAAPQPPPGGQTATVTEQDMKDIHLLIETLSQASGKMPDGSTVYNGLIQAKSPAAALVQQRAIYLMQPKVRESVWALEAKALTQGGMIVTQNGVETVTAAEAKRRTGQ